LAAEAVAAVEAVQAIEGIEAAAADVVPLEEQQQPAAVGPWSAKLSLWGGGGRAFKDVLLKGPEEEENPSPELVAAAVTRPKQTPKDPKVPTKTGVMRTCQVCDKGLLLEWEVFQRAQGIGA
jgi:hypothetical protein